MNVKLTNNDYYKIYIVAFVQHLLSTTVQTEYLTPWIKENILTITLLYIFHEFRHIFMFAVSFYGASYIHLSVQEAKSATDISFRFRTHLADAMLLLAAGKTDYCLIKLESGRLKVYLLHFFYFLFFTYTYARPTFHISSAAAAAALYKNINIRTRKCSQREEKGINYI